jgi:4'-phosphopantetheinyl transferase
LAQTPHDARDLADFAARADAGNRLLRRRLARALLSSLAQVAPTGILLGRSPQGAPSVLAPQGWYLSVAGQAPLCLVGVAAHPIGVDVEPVDDAPPLWDMLTRAEADSLRRLPSSAWPREWLRRWTAKEAHAKRLGCARGADPAGIATTPVASGRLRVRSSEGRSDVFVRAVRGRIEAVALAAEPV